MIKTWVKIVGGISMVPPLLPQMGHKGLTSGARKLIVQGYTCLSITFTLLKYILINVDWGVRRTLRGEAGGNYNTPTTLGLE